MNQHSIQRAYLKGFADKSGRVWVYSKTEGRPIPRSPTQCAAEEDFQSPELESYQQQVIDTPGIRALRVDGSLSAEEFGRISLWMGLHIIRIKKAREQLFESAADYEQRFRDELWKEQLFSEYYRYAYIHVVPAPNFVITSDDPVVEFTCADFFIRACALSPQKLIFFSRVEGKFEHELPMHNFFNAMMWGSSGDHIYSHRADLDVDQLNDFAREFDIRSVIEDLRFEVLGSGDGL